MDLKKAIAGLAAAFGGMATVPSGNALSLQDFNHIVVLYQENHSFDNLFGLWGDVNGEPVNGMNAADAEHTIQVQPDGMPYKCLRQTDVNLLSPSPLPASCSDTGDSGAVFVSAFKNAPFKIDDYIAPQDTTCPAPGERARNGKPKGSGIAGGCTSDLTHRFYVEQYQINQGHQNRYATGSDAAGLTMGYYDTRRLPIYRYLHEPGAPNYVIADSFFQAAFGGSFLNHQWLIAAATPVFASAKNDGGKDDLHASVDVNGMPVSTPLYTSPQGAGKKDYAPLTISCAAAPANIACGDYVVNTIEPFYEPYRSGIPVNKRLPPLTNPTIGDRLSQAGIDWAWYAGGWSNANGDVGAPGWTNGAGPKCTDSNADPAAAFPHCPDRLFQCHHQPFNYYMNFAPGTGARAAHLRDETEFIEAARTGTLKAVSFVKGFGEEDEHPGSTGESRGNQHLVDLIRTIVNGPNGEDTLIIVTYDEYGGAWDHVPPPPYGRANESVHDVWGPGTRVPALLVAKKFAHSGVDHRDHDTTSILKLIEERFHLEPLGSRDAAVTSLATAIGVAQD